MFIKGSFSVSTDETWNIKPPTTFKEQLELYRSRNLIISDEKFAENTLERINYYRLRGYTLTLMDPEKEDKFLDGASFDELLSLYEFDRRMRHLLHGVLETLEIAFRTHITYHIAHSYGPLGYENKEIFINDKFHADFLNKLKDELRKGQTSELFIRHHFERYNGKFPIWVAIEVISFGSLSKLYRNLNPEIKQAIGNIYNDTPYLYIESWLQTLSNIRNTCAHYGRLYNKRLTFKPKLFTQEKRFIDNERLFSAVYIIVKLLNKTEGSRFITDLEALMLEYENVIDFTRIGFTGQWRDQLVAVNSRKDK